MSDPRLLVLACTLVAATMGWTAAGAATVPAHGDSSGGARYPAAAYAGSVPPATPVTLYVSLPGRHHYEIPNLIAAQNAPASPLYHRYLTADQFGSYFGADPTALTRAIDALSAHGFVIDSVPANRRDLVVHAPASVIESTFGTPLDVRVANGRSFYTPRYEPAIPPFLRGAAVYGLDTYGRLHPKHRRHPRSRIGNRKGWAPPDIQSTYDLSPIYGTATGKGITVVDATVGLARQSDFSAFTTRFGLGAQLISTTVGGKAPDDNNGETTLDVEWIAGVAPDATIDQVSPASASNKDFDAMYSYIVNSMSNVHIVTTSWGGCEQQWGSDFALDENLFQQAYTEGQWWLSASGDDGSDDCGTGVKSVDFPGSSPYVVSVGGTEVTPASRGHARYRGWKSEATWGLKGDGASGGGASTVFSKPAFQQGLTPNDGARDVPDVALMADDFDRNGAYLVYFKGSWQNGWGGTSFAAPMWAGFLSLVAQSHGGTVTSPLVRLYALAGSSQYGSLFHDITAGCNAFRNVPGYCAAPGYDQATGLGSFVGANLEGAY